MDRKQIWFALLGFPENRILSKRAKICSMHFETSDFNYRTDGVTFLKADAFPKPVNPFSFSPSGSR